MTTGSDIIQKLKDENIKYLDLRFTDLRGKLQHVTMDVSVVDIDMFEEGVMFDGSSIAGWKAINESDMVLMPIRSSRPRRSRSTATFSNRPPTSLTTAIRARSPRRLKRSSSRPALATRLCLARNPNSSSSTT